MIRNQNSNNTKVRNSYYIPPLVYTEHNRIEFAGRLHLKAQYMRRKSEP